MRFRQFLNQPVRVFNTNRKKWIYIISSMIFAAFFLLFYTPFGISEEMEKESTTVLRIISFVGGEVIAIFISLFFVQFIVLKRLAYTSIVLNKYLRFFFLEMLCVAFFSNTILEITEHLFFPYELIDDDGSFELLSNYPILAFILDSILTVIPQIFVLSYPFMGCLLYFYVNDLKEEVYELESELKSFKINYKENKNDHIHLDLLDENNQIEFTVSLNQMLALESSNQYVLLYYIDENNILAKQIIRTRLKKILNELAHTPTLQCHRSYAVNLLNVEQLKRVDKKSYLTLSGTDLLKIPVSKTYLSDIRDRVVPSA